MKRFPHRLILDVFAVGIIVGVGATTITNAAMKGSAVFRDVPSGHFADDAIGEMVDLGIVKGLSPTLFGPDQPLTRAQGIMLMKRLRDSLLSSGLVSSMRSSSSSSVASSVSSSATSSSVASSSSSSAAPTCSIASVYNPGGYVHFGAKEYNVEKNDATGLVTIVIARIGGNQGAGTVDYTMNTGTATADKDYKPLSGTVSFGSKETSKKVQIQIINNVAEIANKYVTMKLSNPTGAIKIDCPDTATLNINDPRSPKTSSSSSAGASSSSPAAATMLNLSASEYAVMEDGLSLVVNVVRSGVTTGVTEVTYSTSDGTAKSGSEYSFTSGKLTFNAGETSKSIVIPVNDNTSVDGSHTFNINLSAPTNAAGLGQASALVTINDNESSTFGSGSVKFSASIYQVTKSQGKAIITVRHTAGVVPFSVNYNTSNGSAVAGTDYTAASGLLQFAKGEVAKTFEVPITTDRPLTSDLTVNLSLTSATNGVVYADPSNATIKINN